MSSTNGLTYRLSRLIILFTLIIGQSGWASIAHAASNPADSLPVSAPPASPTLQSACTTDQLSGVPNRIDFGGKTRFQKGRISLTV
ncbi:hypothetical protein K2Z83_25970, partial [Oscillochloris sp. ZM17-4]|uniref:hypothetical protein n=1 Tax=Oscillochloris sp. ZM17-4 TaxID=2866714 RepID=UPI001C734294